MAQIFLVNVYEINQVIPSTINKVGFPSAQCQLSAYNGSNSSLYGLITFPVGSSLQKTYATVETQAALQALANA